MQTEAEQKGEISRAESRCVCVETLENFGQKYLFTFCGRICIILLELNF